MLYSLIVSVVASSTTFLVFLEFLSKMFYFRSMCQSCYILLTCLFVWFFSPLSFSFFRHGNLFHYFVASSEWSRSVSSGTRLGRNWPHIPAGKDGTISSSQPLSWLRRSRTKRKREPARMVLSRDVVAFQWSLSLIGCLFARENSNPSNNSLQGTSSVWNFWVFTSDVAWEKIGHICSLLSLL